MPRRIATAVLALLAACGKPPEEDSFGIETLYSLRQLFNETEVAVEGTLVEVDPQTLVAVLKVGRVLRGECPHSRLRLNLGDGFVPYRDLLRRHVEENAPAVFLYAGGSGLLYLNRVFHMGYGGEPPGWVFANVERRMNRTYNGSVESLAALLAADGVLPPARPDLPPVDTPALRALPFPREKVDEEYLPAPFRRGAAPPPLLRAPANPEKVVDGLHLDLFENVTTYRADFDAGPPSRTEVALRLELPEAAKKDHVALRFRGYVDIPKDGDYAFFVRSGGIVELSIGGDRLSPGKTGTRISEQAMDLALKAGRHPFKLTYADAGGEKVLQVSWAGPGFAKQPLPAKALCR